MNRPPGLGRGLSALFGDETEDYAALDRLRGIKTVPIEMLRPGRFQPRRRFDAEALETLAASMREKGVLQPLLVRRDPEAAERYEIVAGERRWRAAQMAGLHDLPVVVRDFDDRDALEVALVENVQRQDLSPLEEAEGYRRLMDEFAHTQEALAKAVGKSRSHVANMLRLLALPDGVKRLIDDGALSAGHARALLGAADPEALAQEVAEKGLNVRETERLAQAVRNATAEPKRGTASDDARGAAEPPDPNTADLERELSRTLGLTTEIEVQRDGRGTLVIHYRTLDQLDDVLRRLRQPVTLPA